MTRFVRRADAICGRQIRVLRLTRNFLTGANGDNGDAGARPQGPKGRKGRKGLTGGNGRRSAASLPVSGGDLAAASGRAEEEQKVEAHPDDDAAAVRETAVFDSVCVSWSDAFPTGG